MTKNKKVEVTASIPRNLKISSTDLHSRSLGKVVEEESKTEETQFQIDKFFKQA